MNHINRTFFPASLLLVLTLAASCGRKTGDNGAALLSLIAFQRMTVLLKGTYATDRPLDFSQINNNRLFQNANPDPARPLDTTDLPAYNALPWYIDIGEIRLSSKDPGSTLINIQNNKDAVKFWDVVSSDRQVYCTQLYSQQAATDTCARTGGLGQFQEFMNGNGAIFPSRDVGPATYVHAGVFVRAFVTGFAKAQGAVVYDTFDNIKVPGTNIEPLVQYNPGSTVADKQGQVPQFFPLHYSMVFGQEQTMTVNDSFQPIVLEIRSNLKENMMVHNFLNTGTTFVQTVVAFSDWAKDHQSEFDMGGNVRTRARMFYPDYTTTLTVTGGTDSVRHYYAVYLADEKNKDLYLPLAATPVRNGTNTIEHLMPGRYELQCREDTVYDGYPETVLRTVPFTIDVPRFGEVTSPVTVALTCP